MGKISRLLEDLSPIGKPKPDCKLVGQDGNAFAIMGRVISALRGILKKIL
jgi:hypothetical protein